jgi:regulatory protein
MPDTVYRITQIEPQKHAEDRFSIYLDGAFAFGLDGEVILRHHLHEGDELSDGMIDDVLLTEERARAKKKALAMLSRFPRSVHDLRQRLLDGDFSERTVERVIRDYIRVGLLDDKAFARTYAQSRLSQRMVGKRLLKQELLHKGIDEETAETAVADSYGALSEEDLARQLAVKKLQQIGSGNKRILQRKLSEFLFRRGFDWDVINPILQETLWQTEE